MRQFLGALSLGALLLLSSGPARAQGPTEFSGMATFGPQSLLVVSDAKADSPASRLGILSLAAPRPWMHPVTVDDWKGEPPNDLEACCPVPGSADEFLLAESGWWKGRFGRVFRVKLFHDPAQGWKGTVLSTCTPFAAPQDGSTPSADQVEGIAATTDSSGRLVVLLGRRGGAGSSGKLVWGHLDEAGFTALGEKDYSLEGFVPGGRSCGDLQLLEQGGAWKVLSVAASDPGDRGPFRSAVCEVGTLRTRGGGPVRFEPAPPRALWRLDGLKVEALAPTPSGIEDSTFCVGTDDEVYGGLWRPLPADPDR